MVLHLSILVLLLILSLIYENKIKTEKVAAALSENGDYHFNSTLIPWLLFLGFIAFLAFVRTDTNDTAVYRDLFKALKPSWENITEIIHDDSKDKGFYIFENFFKMYISDNYHMWFLFFSATEAIILIKIFRKEAVSFLDSMYFFFASTLYFNFFSMMRQWFAVCVVFTGIKFLKKGKFFPYLLLCLFAAQFHNSAYIMIPVYFLVRGVAWGKRQITVIALFVIALFFFQPILNTLESSDGTYDYVISAMNSNSGSSIIRPVIAIVPVALAYMNKDKINKNDQGINICINMSLLNFLLNLLATFTSGLYIIRLSTYMNMYNIILYPYLFNVALNDHKNKNIIKVVFYVLYFALYMYEMNNSRAFPYYSNVIGFFK